MASMIKSFIVSILLIIWACTAFAHEPQLGGSGFMHVFMEFKHLSGFVVIGAIAGLYLGACKGQLFVYGAIIPFSLFASHSHVPLVSWTGFLFSFGFLCAGILIACAVASIFEVPARSLADRWLK